MSLFWKPPRYDHRQRENNWINGILHLHDQFCGCDEPFKHLVYKLAEEAPKLNLNKEDLLILQKCHPTTTTIDDGTTGDHGTEDGAGPDDNIDIGDLEKLFEDDLQDAEG